MNRLKGIVAIVTGAGSGIGRSSAMMLAEEGAQTVLAGRRSQPLDEAAAEITARGGRAWARPADVEIEEQARGLARWTLAELGRVDILVNSAGYPARVRSIRWVGTEAWDRALRVNLTGPYFLVQEVLPAMIDQGGGTIITVASMAALKGSLMGGAAYASAKAGVVNMMHQVNAEFRESGVRACSIIPGEVDTPILNTRPRPPDAEARATMMKPDDVGAAVLLCATMPPGTLVEQIHMAPTRQRDQSMDIEANMNEGAPAAHAQ